MILEFTTNIDINGNKYYLGIDTGRKVYALTAAHWYSVKDFVKINKSDRRKMINQLQENDFKEVYTL